MTQRSKSAIKALFQTGDKPSQTDFGDFIDSYLDSDPTLAAIGSAVQAGQIGIIRVTGTAGVSWQELGAFGIKLVSAATTAVAYTALGKLPRANMPTGPGGTVFIFDTNGSAASMAAGTSGQVLKTAGSAGSPSFQTDDAVRSVTMVAFTSSGTYSVPSTLVYAKVEVVGAGGGGGGAGTASGAAGGGGGAGGISIRYLSRSALGGAAATVAVTAGDAGAAGAAAAGNGGNGGSSIFGAFASAAGGQGGTGSAVGDTTAAGGPGGGSSTGDQNFGGADGGGSSGDATAGANWMTGGNGGSNMFGGGGGGGSNGVAGSVGRSAGGGGGGGSRVGTNRAGGAGAHGAVFVTEFRNA